MSYSFPATRQEFQHWLDFQAYSFTSDMDRNGKLKSADDKYKSLLRSFLTEKGADGSGILNNDPQYLPVWVSLYLALAKFKDLWKSEYKDILKAYSKSLHYDKSNVNDEALPFGYYVSHLLSVEVPALAEKEGFLDTLDVFPNTGDKATVLKCLRNVGSYAKSVVTPIP